MPDQKSCCGKVIPKPLNARLSVRKKDVSVVSWKYGGVCYCIHFVTCFREACGSYLVGVCGCFGSEWLRNVHSSDCEI